MIPLQKAAKPEMHSSRETSPVALMGLCLFSEMLAGHLENLVGVWQFRINIHMKEKGERFGVLFI